MGLSRRSAVTRSLIAAVIVLAAALPAQGQQFSLWSDTGQSSSEFWAASPYQQFTIYVFLDPGSDGAKAVEYKLKVPYGHYLSESRQAPIVSDAVIGTPFGPPGVSAGLTSCLTGTAWIFAVTCMASNVDPGIYTLEPHDYSGFIGVATCIEPDRPLAEAKVYNNFRYNTTEGGQEDASWGRIKRRY